VVGADAAAALVGRSDWVASLSEPKPLPEGDALPKLGREVAEDERLEAAEVAEGKASGDVVEPIGLGLGGPPERLTRILVERQRKLKATLVGQLETGRKTPGRSEKSILTKPASQIEAPRISLGETDAKI
jgi:hypothetical protein